MSWPLVGISEFCSTGSGGTPSRKKAEYYDGAIPWIKSGDLREAEVTSATEFISELAIKESSAKIVPKGAILLAMYGATVGRMAMLGIDAATNQAVCNIIPDESKAYPRYVYYALLSIVPEFLRNAVGGAQPNINQGMIRDTKIPLPPLSEQKRIAAILDKADNLRRKRQEAIQLADEFLRSVFLDMFGDPVTNPKGWERRELGDFIASGDRINYGIVQPGDHMESGVPIVRVGDFRNGRVDKSNLKRVAIDVDSKHKKSRLVGDEILVACVGATVGKVALADPSISGFNTVRAVTRIRLSEEVNRYYFFRYLQSPFIQGYFKQQLRTVGQPTLNGAQIAKTPILLPDKNLQNNYLEVVQKVERWINRAEHQILLKGKLYSSISNECFF